MKKLTLLLIFCITVLTGCNKHNKQNNSQNEYEPIVNIFENERNLNNIDKPQYLQILQSGNPSIGFIRYDDFWSTQFVAIPNDGSHYDGYRIYIIDDSIKHIGNYTYFTVDSVWKTVPIVNIEY